MSNDLNHQNTYAKIWGLAENENSSLDYAYMKIGVPNISTKRIASLLGVQENDVRIITEQEYIDNTEDDDEING